MTNASKFLASGVASALLAVAACSGPATSEDDAVGGGDAAAPHPITGALGAPLTAASSSADAGPLTPGWYLVAIDTPTRTYLDYVQVPAGGTWRPDVNGWPLIAQWAQETTFTALRFLSFTPGATVTPANIVALLPATAPASTQIDITAYPYLATVSPADATQSIQAALDAGASLASAAHPVDVIVPPGTFEYGAVLKVGAYVRLRGAGGVLRATDAAHSAVHLGGDGSGALFLTVVSSASSRGTTPDCSGIWVGGRTGTDPPVHDTLVVGNEVIRPMGAHVFGLGEVGGLWAFNYAHDGYADTFTHTGVSQFCQVVANRAAGNSTCGDDLYSFIGYAGAPDPVHHCSCVANSGLNGHARGLSACGAGYIDFEHNVITTTRDAGIYIANDGSFATYGDFNVTVAGNTITGANQVGTHDGLLAYSCDPTTFHPSTSFGNVSDAIRDLVVTDNSFFATAPGAGNGYGIEVRSSCDTGAVTRNTVAGATPPGIVVSGTAFTVSGNTFTVSESASVAPAASRSWMLLLGIALAAVGMGLVPPGGGRATAKGDRQGRP